MALTLSLLFDENVEAQFARDCAKDGHDVQRVVELGELGEGATDAQIRTYAWESGRIVVTHDDDFVKADPTTHRGVFYIPEQRRSAFECYRILTAVCEAYPDRDALPSVVYLTEDWL